jgi:hypothetical protein
MATSRARTAAKRGKAGVDLDSAAFLAGFRKAVAGMRVDSTQMMTRVGLTAQNEARRFSPVRTGRLRAGWMMTTSESGGRFRVKISNNVNYAPHVEYGTQHSAAQPMIRPALLVALRKYGMK